MTVKMKKLLKNGVHRPLTMFAQEVLELNSDGFFGGITEQAVFAFQEENKTDNPESKPDGIIGNFTLQKMIDTGKGNPLLRIMELISLMEVDTCNNAWKATSVVEGDGGGTNYGPLQLNRGHGSVQTYCKNYLPAGQVFEEFYCTSAGAKKMFQYMLDFLVNPARHFLQDFNEPEESVTIGLVIDGATQGGAPYPSHPVRTESMSKNWKEGVIFEEWRNYILSVYSGIAYSESSKVKVAFTQSMNKAKELGIDFKTAYAELHPRSGDPQWLADQLSRRRMWSTGSSVIHGITISLSNVGF
jgi:hypothetical protein